jgi:prepilin-type N-terminal cleavage/methylation domain-containing protein
MHPRSSHQAFTLIELLIVIAIIAILSVVVILVLNPVQLLMQARDSNRVSDMATMTEALGVYQTDQTNGSLGSQNTVYVSIPDPTASSSLGDQCQGLGLISLPSSYAYHCAASSTFRSVNGTGWIPVTFTSASFGSPIGSLPADPVNQSSSRLYYTYTTNGSQFEFTAPMESQKYQIGGSNDVISTDGGALASVYEKGTKFGLEPLDYGDSSLVGWWNFSEGTGTIAYDYSGNNATGSWSGTQSGTNGYYSAGKVGGWAGTFASNTDVVASVSGLPSGGASRSIFAWIKTSDATDDMDFMGYGTNACSQLDFKPGVWAGKLALQWYCGDWQPSVPMVADGNWHYVGFTYNGTTLIAYQDGTMVASTNESLNTGVSNFQIGEARGGYGFTGLIDDVRIYNRALSAVQIDALYAGGK